MASPWPLSNWPRQFPLIHKPVIVLGACDPVAIPFGRAAEWLGITFNALGQFRHRRFGPRHRWQGSRFIILAADLDSWFNRAWRPGEQAMLAELQHTDPADFLKHRARSSLEQIGEIQRLMSRRARSPPYEN